MDPFKEQLQNEKRPQHVKFRALSIRLKFRTFWLENQMIHSANRFPRVVGDMKEQAKNTGGSAVYLVGRWREETFNSLIQKFPALVSNRESRKTTVRTYILIHHPVVFRQGHFIIKDFSAVFIFQCRATISFTKLRIFSDRFPFLPCYQYLNKLDFKELVAKAVYS